MRVLAENGHSETAKILLDNGANAKSVRTKIGDTANDARGCFRAFRSR